MPCVSAFFKDKLNLICGAGHWLRRSLVSDLKHFPDRQKILLTPAVAALYCKSQPVNTQRTMKTRITNSNLILILAAFGIIFLAGCASMQTENTPSLLSQAGFRVGRAA
jgi:hypothetical protein